MSIGQWITKKIVIFNSTFLIITMVQLYNGLLSHRSTDLICQNAPLYTVNKIVRGSAIA